MNKFSKIYQNKTDSELLKIITNKDYLEEARLEAFYILKKRSPTQLTKAHENEIELIEKKDKEKDDKYNKSNRLLIKELKSIPVRDSKLYKNDNLNDLKCIRIDSENYRLIINDARGFGLISPRIFLKVNNDNSFKLSLKVNYYSLMIGTLVTLTLIGITYPRSFHESNYTLISVPLLFVISIQIISYVMFLFINKENWFKLYIYKKI
ncbi:hypothetical protein [Flammeovirga sp. OC4]|uniref:hypothetical protein n=1 Tax=Flammeovirga sp. OC4 TaxID=1382345 RepID=UPI0005C49AFE|nr:hypothetical protein [Flammeovirga sp. OC4]